MRHENERFQYKMKQKRFLTALAMVLLCMCGGVNKVYAQTYPSHSEIMERQRAEQKAKIGLDYSMPDFSTSKLSESVMGKRLARILGYLDEHSNDFKKPTVSLTFTDGISQSANENDLFTHICNYIR